MTTDRPDVDAHDTACPCAPCQRDPYVDPAGPAAPSVRETQAEAVLQYARDVGLQLEPWQAYAIRTMYSGQLVQRPRRNGMTTVRQLIAEYHVTVDATSRSPWSPPHA